MAHPYPVCTDAILTWSINVHRNLFMVEYAWFNLSVPESPPGVGRPGFKKKIITKYVNTVQAGDTDPKCCKNINIIAFHFHEMAMFI